MNSDSLSLINALADIRNRQIVLSKFSKDTELVYSDSHVYAVAKSVYPIFHEQRFLETNPDIFKLALPYYDTYKFSEQTVNELHDFLVEKWNNKETVTFYELEHHYWNSWPNFDLRVGLIFCLRYFFLEGEFDEKFWQHVSSGPVEASSIIKDFDKANLL